MQRHFSPVINVSELIFLPFGIQAHYVRNLCLPSRNDDIARLGFKSRNLSKVEGRFFSVRFIVKKMRTDLEGITPHNNARIQLIMASLERFLAKRQGGALPPYPPPEVIELKGPFYCLGPNGAYLHI